MQHLIGSRAASFKRPSVSVDVWLSLCVGNFDISGKLSDLWIHVQQGAYSKVRMARRLVTSAMTPRDSMTSCSWRHSLQSRLIRKTMTQIN